MLNHQLNGNSEGLSLTFVLDGELYTVRDTHPKFSDIRHIVQGDDAEVQATLPALMDFEKVLQAEHEAEAERVEQFTTEATRRMVGEGLVHIVDGEVYFDGEVMDTALTRHMLDRARQGENITPLIRFMRKIMANPSKKSRKHLFIWLQKAGLTITDDGDFIGYKGVKSDGTSISAGPGIVNGVAMNGHLPNEIGNIIEMAREDVNDDRNVGCSVGLHVGNHGYAIGFGSRLLTVKVNPADVVSVPKDCFSQKMRVCRYEVIDIGPAAELPVAHYHEGQDNTTIASCSCGSASSELCGVCDEDFWGCYHQIGSYYYCGNCGSNDPECSCSCSLHNGEDGDKTSEENAEDVEFIEPAVAPSKDAIKALTPEQGQAFAAAWASIEKLVEGVLDEDDKWDEKVAKWIHKSPARSSNSLLIGGLRWTVQAYHSDEMSNADRNVVLSAWRSLFPATAD